MIDAYAKISIAIRLCSLVLFSIVLFKQVRILRKSRSLLWTKVGLMTITLVLITASVLSLTVNFYRDGAGNVEIGIRHATMIAIALASLVAGIALLVLYDKE